MAQAQAGDPAHFIARQEDGLIIAIQPNPAAPFVPVAYYNIIAAPAEFADTLLEVLT